jgi:hypothetical protein
MLISCVTAYVFPFELFLFSYAVSGPLHYLTEISWLHDRKYFVNAGPEQRAWPAQRFWLGLVVVRLAVMLYGLAAEKILKQAVSPTFEIGLFYGVFVSASMLVFLKNKAICAALIVLTALALVVFSGSRYFGLIAFLLHDRACLRVYGCVRSLRRAEEQEPLGRSVPRRVSSVHAEFLRVCPGSPWFDRR